jgi:hypothetical protein
MLLGIVGILYYGCSFLFVNDVEQHFRKLFGGSCGKLVSSIFLLIGDVVLFNNKDFDHIIGFQAVVYFG